MSYGTPDPKTFAFLASWGPGKSMAGNLSGPPIEDRSIKPRFQKYQLGKSGRGMR
jgi:hypothetical protein